MRDYSCVGVEPDGVSVTVMDCAKARPWKYGETEGTLSQRGKCLGVGSVNNIYTAVMQECVPKDEMQRWTFSRFDRRGLQYQDFAKAVRQ